MARDSAALIVELKANLTDFEKKMKEAGVLADAKAKDIESSFEKVNPRFNALVSGLGSAIGTGAAKLLDFIKELGQRFEELQRTAKYTGVALQEVFAIQAAGGKKGIEPGDINTGLTSLANLLDRAKRGQDNSLAKLFEVNNIDISKIQNAGQAWLTVAGLVQNARNEIQKADIAEAAGQSSKMIGLLEQGPVKLAAIQSAAAANAPDLQKIADLAKDFNKAWEDASEALKNKLLSVFGELKPAIVDFVKSTVAELRELEKGLNLFENMVKVAGASTGLHVPGEDLAAKARRLEKELEDQRGPNALVTILQRSKAENPTPDSPLPPPLPTNLRPTDPPKGQGTSTFDPNRPATNTVPFKPRAVKAEKLDSFEREERRAKEQTDRLREETSVIGLNTEARTAALEKLKLEQMAKREGIEIDDSYRKRIDETSAALGREAAAHEDARERLRGTLALQNYAGQEMLTVLDQITEGGAKASDVMAGLAKSVARALAQAALLGTGPFANMLNMQSSAPGQAGGLIGLISSMMPKFAGGGSVRGPGTGTSDSILALLSAGEFVVKADAAERNRGWLEAMNAGKLARFADGGMVYPGAECGRELILPRPARAA